MTSETIRALSDMANGGPARAFECLLPDFRTCKPDKLCGFVSRTLRGMRSHQRSVHGFRPQAKLFVAPEEKSYACVEK